jgi:hypothetical protein
VPQRKQFDPEHEKRNDQPTGKKVVLRTAAALALALGGAVAVGQLADAFEPASGANHSYVAHGFVPQP